MNTEPSVKLVKKEGTQRPETEFATYIPPAIFGTVFAIL